MSKRDEQWYSWRQQGGNSASYIVPFSVNLANAKITWLSMYAFYTTSTFGYGPGQGVVTISANNGFMTNLLTDNSATLTDLGGNEIFATTEQAWQGELYLPVGDYTAIVSTIQGTFDTSLVGASNFSGFAFRLNIEAP